MKTTHFLIAATLRQARTMACLLVTTLFLCNGYGQGLTFDAAAQGNLKQKRFIFEPGIRLVETQRDAGSLIMDGFANQNFQLDTISRNSNIKTDFSAVAYHGNQILFSPLFNWQHGSLKASGSKRLYKFLTAAAFTALGAYFLATSESERSLRNDGFFTIYRVTPEGRKCIENCPSWHTDRDWKFAAGLASFGAAAGFIYWGIAGN